MLAARQAALRQQVAEALAGGDHFNQLVIGLRVVPLELDPAGIGFAQQAALEAFHCPGEGRPGGDGVQPQAVAQLVAGGHGDDIIHAQVGAQQADQFVFRAAVLAGDREGAIRAFHRALARDRAGIAGLGAPVQHLLHALAADPLRAIERPVLEVIGGQDARTR